MSALWEARSICKAVTYPKEDKDMPVPQVSVSTISWMCRKKSVLGTALPKMADGSTQ